MEESVAALLDVFGLPINDEYIAKYKTLLSTSPPSQPISDIDKETYKKKLRTIIKNYADYQTKESELVNDVFSIIFIFMQNSLLCDNINEFLYHLSGNYSIRGKIRVAKSAQANRPAKVNSSQRSATPSSSSRSSFSSPYRPSTNTTGRSSSTMSRTTVSESPLLKEKPLSSFASSTVGGTNTSSFAIKAPPLKGLPNRNTANISQQQSQKPLKSTINSKMYNSTTSSSSSSTISESLLNRPEFSASTERTPIKRNNNNAFTSPPPTASLSASKIKKLGIVNHAVDNNEEEEEVRRQLYQQIQEQQQEENELNNNDEDDSDSSESESEEKV